MNQDLYFSGREMTRPYTSGLVSKQMTLEQMQSLSPLLTSKEKKSPFAFHYKEPMAPLTPELQAALVAPPLKPEDCYMPAQAGRILLARGSDGFPENGYGILDNGVGFAAIKIDQPGVTDPMVRKYREEFAHEEDNRTLFYKLWYPGKHYIHFEDAIIEDFGWGPVFQEMNWDCYGLKDLGISIDEVRSRDPNCLAFVVLGGETFDLADPSARSHNIMVQYTHETPWGRELRVRYWHGLTLRPDGSFQLEPEALQDESKVLRHMKGMMEHCMRESMNELRLMRNFMQTGR